MRSLRAISRGHCPACVAVHASREPPFVCAAGTNHKFHNFRTHGGRVDCVADILINGLPVSDTAPHVSNAHRCVPCSISQMTKIDDPPRRNLLLRKI